MRVIEQVKQQFQAEVAPLAAKMTAEATANGFKSPEYQAMSEEYRSIRLRYGICMRPSAPSRWTFMKNREAA